MAHGCKNCRYFMRTTNQPGGWCRRYPPKYKPFTGSQTAGEPGAQKSEEYHWPFTKDDGWCGEWKDQNPPA